MFWSRRWGCDSAACFELWITWHDRCSWCYMTLQTTMTLYGRHMPVSTACWRSPAKPRPATTPCWHSIVPATVATTRAWPPTATCRSRGTVTSTCSFYWTGRAPADNAVQSTSASIDSLTRVAMPSSLSSSTDASQVCPPISSRHKNKISPKRHPIKLTTLMIR